MHQFQFLELAGVDWNWTWLEQGEKCKVRAEVSAAPAQHPGIYLAPGRHLTVFLGAGCLDLPPCDNVSSLTTTANADRREL
jgi:hypothetical protein